jgi:hypothetical protein
MTFTALQNCEVIAMKAELAAERCEVCNTELSQCGVQGVDGEPSMDCLVCKLREQLAAEREKREQAEGEEPFDPKAWGWVGQDGQP